MVFFTCVNVSISFNDIRNESVDIFLPIEAKYLRIINLYSDIKFLIEWLRPFNIMCRCVPVTVYANTFRSFLRAYWGIRLMAFMKSSGSINIEELSFPSEYTWWKSLT